MRLWTAFGWPVILFCATLFSGTSYAAASEGREVGITLENLPAACRAAKSEFRAFTPADVEEARQELLEAIGRLDRRLSLAGGNGEAWRKYLEWDVLRTELQGNRQPDKAVLTRLHARYNAGYDGLELVWFLDVQRGLHRYIAMANAVASPQIRNVYEGVLDGLAESLQRYATKPTTEDALVVSESVRWLRDARQASRLVRAIEQHFTHPNVLVEISADVVGAGIAEPVDDTMEISDCILGTSVRGTAHTTGKTRVELVPNAEMGVIDALFLGITRSDNIGSHPPVTIFSSSTTELAARKRMWIDANGLSAHPAASRAETAIVIHDIRSHKGRRLIERMAWKRAGKQQGQAECIASRHAEQRLNERIDAQAAEPLERANRQYVEKYQTPFKERKLFPELLRFSTSQQALAATALQAGDGKLGAPSAPPPVVEGADMSLRIHESMINNLAFDALAGRTVYEEKVQTAATELLGHLPEKMRGDDDGIPWAITFAPRQPISVTFAEDGFRVTLRGVRYYKGTEAHPAMNVSASYKIEKSPQGYKVVRQGEIEVFPPDFVPSSGEQIDARRQVIRTLLAKRFAKVFEAEFLGEGLVLPGKWQAAGKLQPVQVVCRDGWLVIAWKRAAAEQKSVAGLKKSAAK